jgi:hypothetical protein
LGAWVLGVGGAGAATGAWGEALGGATPDGAHAARKPAANTLIEMFLRNRNIKGHKLKGRFETFT